MKIFFNIFKFFIISFVLLFTLNNLNKVEAVYYDSQIHQPCSEYKSPNECNNNCSPYKTTTGESFYCKWSYTQGACKESANICSSSSGGGGGTIIGGKNCTRINKKCYECGVEKGDANHYTCSYIPTNGRGCPNKYQTGKVTKTYLGFLNAGKEIFCFDSLPDACGSEQIDWKSSDPKGGFISRKGPTVCYGSTPKPSLILTKTPTPTPKVTLTPTPTFVPLICQEMRVYLNGIRITDLSKIKYGDTVTYKAYANISGRSVKSMTFQYLISGIIIEKVVAPATLANGVWSATYRHTISRYGAHRVRIVAITPL